MATFKICVFEHHKRKDGKFPVTIRVFWKGKSAYLKTEYYVTIEQIRKKKDVFELKDTFIINELNARIVRYENLKVQRLGQNIELYTARDLVEYFKREGAPGTDASIDFIEFSLKHCQKLEAKGKKSTATPLRTVIYSLIDFQSGRTQISISEITSRFLMDFEQYLQQPRTIKRKNQHGKMVVTKRPGLSTIGIFDYMTSVKTLFNAARSEFNDEDRGEIRIKHYPFRKYKPKKAPEPAKRVLKVEQIRAILSQNDKNLEHFRAILARDVFTLSFYLAGMNLADLYSLEAGAYKDGRISYNRKKTRDRRQDNAFISIKVFPKAEALIKKYRDPSGERLFNFANLYTTSEIFTSNVNKGLKHVAEVCKIEEYLTTYYARFSFATIARNNCIVSKDDISLCLNHVDHGMKVTDTYLQKDWGIVDRTIEAVIEFVQKSNPDIATGATP